MVKEFVVAVGEAFDALQRSGRPVTPTPLRIIFERMPRWFATRYWRRQFDSPTVELAIEPHVLATRDTEFPQLVDHALSLVGDAAPRYRSLLESLDA